ncbi:MAG: ABC transporter permease [Prevotella sp.]|nr:ABC transporter permease [Prevotella sp.]
MKLKKKELLYQEAGKYFLDLSKLVFGGIILAEIMNLNINDGAIFGIGGVAVVGFALFGFHYYSKSKK